MNALDTLTALPSLKSGIVIPSTKNCIVPGDYNLGEVKKTTCKATKKELAPVLYQAKTFFSQFGGFTINSQCGGWVDRDTYTVVEETSQFIWSYTILDEDTTTTLILIAQSIKALLCQDSILIVVNGLPYLV